LPQENRIHGNRTSTQAMKKLINNAVLAKARKIYRVYKHATNTTYLMQNNVLTATSPWQWSRKKRVYQVINWPRHHDHVVYAKETVDNCGAKADTLQVSLYESRMRVYKNSVL